MLLVGKNVVGIEVLHNLTMKDVLHHLAADGCQRNWPVVRLYAAVASLLMGVTSAVFKSSGTLPCCSGAVKIGWTVGATSDVASLRNLVQSSRKHTYI